MLVAPGRLGDRPDPGVAVAELTADSAVFSLGVWVADPPDGGADGSLAARAGAGAPGRRGHVPRHRGRGGEVTPPRDAAIARTTTCSPTSPHKRRKRRSRERRNGRRSALATLVLLLVFVVHGAAGRPGAVAGAVFVRRHAHGRVPGHARGRPAGHQLADLRPRRPPAGDDLVDREPHAGQGQPDLAVAEDRDRRRRGQALLAARRPRLPRHHPRGARQPPGRPDHAGCLHARAAAGAKPVPVRRAVVPPARSARPSWPRRWPTSGRSARS